MWVTLRGWGLTGRLPFWRRERRVEGREEAWMLVLSSSLGYLFKGGQPLAGEVEGSARSELAVVVKRVTTTGQLSCLY